VKIRFESTIDAPAAAAWQKLGTEFDQIADFFSQVDFSRAITADELPAGFQVIKGAPVLGRYTESRVLKATEVLTAYSDTEMTFTFEAVDVPAFMLSKSRNTTRIQPITETSCKVTIDVEMGLRHLFNLMSPLLNSRMNKLFSRLFVELEAAARKI
jgi:hypothetical protein